jgi:predicted PurR-regulated permease PerM
VKQSYLLSGTKGSPQFDGGENAGYSMASRCASGCGYRADPYPRNLKYNLTEIKLRSPVFRRGSYFCANTKPSICARERSIREPKIFRNEWLPEVHQINSNRMAVRALALGNSKIRIGNSNRLQTRSGPHGGKELRSVRTARWLIRSAQGKCRDGVNSIRRERPMWSGGSPSAVVNGAAGLIIAALLIAALYVGRDLLIPLALAGILSFILFPLVRRLIHWGVPQGLAVSVVITALVVALLGSITLGGHQVAQLLEEVPRHETNLREKARYLHSLVGGTGIWQRAINTLRNIEEEVRDPETESKPLKIEVAQDRTMAVFLEYTRSTLPSIATAGLTLVVTIFMLLQYGDLRDRAVRLMGASEIGRSTQALTEAGYDLAHFFLLQASLNASFGILVGVALWLIGIPSPGLWGATAALMRFVPYVGSALAAVFPVALAAMIDPGWWMLLETAAVFLVGDIIVGQFVEPVVFGTHTRLSSIAVVLGAAFWTLLWGPVGLILAVPLTLTIVVMGQHVPHLEILRILLGNEPVLEPQEKLYRQLLAGDAAEAATDADRWLHEHGLLKYLDRAAIPSLHIASDDHRRGVLAGEKLDELKYTLSEYTANVRELLDFMREQQHAQAPADAAPPPDRTATAVVIAGRGIIDQTAAELVADAIRFDLGMPTQCPSLGGLTGISAAAATMNDVPPDIVLLISVGGVTTAQLDLLSSRVRRVFEGSAITIGYWCGSGASGSPSHKGDEVFVFAETVDSLLSTVGRIADERTMTPRRPPPLKVV